MFAGVLNDDDARRATEVVDAVLAHGLRCALTGGLAIDARLRTHGRAGERRSLNDIDFVVEDFASIPESLAGAFLQHHVHPDATDGRTLLQLVDQPRAIRIDLFCALGGSLSRASKLAHDTGDLDVLSVEDLIARTTAFVCGRLERGETIDVKHAAAFNRLRPATASPRSAYGVRTALAASRTRGCRSHGTLRPFAREHGRQAAGQVAGSNLMWCSPLSRREAQTVRAMVARHARFLDYGPQTRPD